MRAINKLLFFIIFDSLNPRACHRSVSATAPVSCANYSRVRPDDFKGGTRGRPPGQRRHPAAAPHCTSAKMRSRIPVHGFDSNRSQPSSTTVRVPARPDKVCRASLAVNEVFPKMLKAGSARRLAALDSRQVLEPLDAAGAVLLRGFDFDMDEFEVFTARFCDRFHEVGSRVRLRREGDGYSSEVFRDNFTLLAHSEGCYRPWPPPPELCFFCCLTPPSAPGGETTLVDGVRFAEHLPGDLRSRFLSSGVSYESHWEAERWRAEFQVADVRELDHLLRGLAGVRYTIEGD
ncbi:MAG: hypothetical protein EHM68_09525, partial [Lysobacterales bacterium]